MASKQQNIYLVQPSHSDTSETAENHNEHNFNAESHRIVPAEPQQQQDDAADAVEEKAAEVLISSLKI
jgi:hypothetical protein